MAELILFTSCRKKEAETIYGSISDIEGNKYKTVVIGVQTWMAENLKTTTMNDSTSIPYVIDAGDWSALITPAYCLYRNDPDSYKSSYGTLYNWFAVNTGKLCPTGWHIPTDEEWTVMTDYLGGEEVAGGKLKESGTLHWTSFPEITASNESGFTALGSGAFYYNLTYNVWDFYPINEGCFFWSSSKHNTDLWGRFLFYGNNKVLRIILSESYGCSVRCLKDK